MISDDTPICDNSRGNTDSTNPADSQDSCIEYVEDIDEDSDVDYDEDDGYDDD